MVAVVAASRTAFTALDLKVVGAGDGGVLIVEPIERNISYRQLRASEISEHWTHTDATRREGRRPPAQTTLDLSLPA